MLCIFYHGWPERFGLGFETFEHTNNSSLTPTIAHAHGGHLCKLLSDSPATAPLTAPLTASTATFDGTRVRSAATPPKLTFPAKSKFATSPPRPTNSDTLTITRQTNLIRHDNPPTPTSQNLRNSHSTTSTDSSEGQGRAGVQAARCTGNMVVMARCETRYQRAASEGMKA
ncbi:hypothetical protein AC578_3526 [Pseudocercospora eumusae]|uniref:Uncharacterized protein n=1 Tax=Pseudocercospora eumusae TaxID=321146 RepID=A0A139H9I1_9PEZI|nr:hypothetical protein AC578_3526 [Pseudocercospora eumusae]